MSRVWIEEDGNLILHHADLQENRPHKKYKKKISERMKIWPLKERY